MDVTKLSISDLQAYYAIMKERCERIDSINTHMVLGHYVSQEEVNCMKNAQAEHAFYAQIKLEIDYRVNVLIGAIEND